MSRPVPLKSTASLLERAAALYDIGQHRGARQPDGVEGVYVPTMTGVSPTVLPPSPPVRATTPNPDVPAATIDRALLAEQHLLVPGAAVGALAEEFRLVKRQLMATARALRPVDPTAARTFLVTSANPNDGKTYCALNLAISLAAERDVEVLLVDADFAKPDVMARVGLSEGKGVLDALADPSVCVEQCIVRTDIPHLSLLPCGTKTTADTELVASARTGEMIAALLAADPRRIIIFDSPPVLAASPAAVLAGQVGQVMIVVRADRTSEGDLREAVALLDGCDHLQLLLNAVGYAPGGRRYGSYYERLDEGK
ncbi:AAA family ATPase [Sphingomonas sp. CARO-RG-8B-R24-01]|uniref:AAA family ATPase n=1 Tax=Sphingomonas sp. CARO-RG-8B-R24-01 TaxID=2914831 RepID=UPI001F5878B7|nr:AAA family ATPase [Sphingomonas sp. CARO-RG-8B-R24-01]